MKNLLLKIFILSLMIISCKETFSPEADYRERNVLNCIIRADSNFQSVTLFRTYKTSGDPNLYSESTFINGADVKMWYDNKVFQFNDTSFVRKDVSRYKEPVRVYYNNKLNPIGGKYVEVEALLPNGLLLRSETLVPDAKKISFEGSDQIIPSTKNGNELKFVWSYNQSVMFAPRLIVTGYNKATEKQINKQIAIKYFERNSVEEPIYPSLSSQKGIVFDLNAVRKSFYEISDSDPVKSNYSITGAYLELMVLDKGLSIYYSSIENFLDEFTIKVDLPDYSNIEGGFGVFGSYSITKFPIVLNPDFVKSFGYNPSY